MHLLVSMEDWRERISKLSTVFVFFTRESCGPCKAMAQVLMLLKVSQQIIEIDVEEFPEIAAKYFIRSTPTLCSFNSGRMWNQYVGGYALKDLERFILKEDR